MSKQPTVIYSAANTQQAYLLRGLLADRGITAHVVNDSIQIAGGDLPLRWTAAPRVVVAEDDATEARQIAIDFDHQTAHDPLPEDAIDEPEASEWADWPVCPSCRERRSARCSICHVSGTNFPLNDAEPPEEGGRVFLVCEACDDLMLPEWYRLCPRCGHDYGDGFQVGGPMSAAGYTARSLLVLGVMLAGTILFAAYFVWLFAK